MTDKKKDQYIIAYLPIIDNNKTVLAHAEYLAHMLNKGLILLHICDPKYNTYETNNCEGQLKFLSTSTHSNYCILKGNTNKIIEGLPTLLNSIAVIIEVDPSSSKKSPFHPKNVLKDFSNCNTAWLTVQPDIEPNYDNVALTIDFARESKEKLVWASYFTRFGNSKLHVLYQEYKDEGLQHLWYSNMLFLHKLYDNLEIAYSPHPIPGKSVNVDTDALLFMKKNNLNILVTVTTANKRLLDQLFGTPEQKTIQNKEKIPILFLNPRKDLYILCE